MASYDFTWKIMMLGDADAGKTSLTIRYISGFFLEDLKLTIGVDFYSKTTNYNRRKVKLQIWDFAGEERFRFLLHQYCKGANAAFFLFNITNRFSLDNLPDWIQIIREHAGDIPILMVGTKLHLAAQRAITRDQGIQAMRIHNLSGFIEVSSKTGQNVEKLFDLMTEILFDRYKPDGMKTRSRYPKIKVNKSINFGLKNDKAYQKRIEELQGLSFIGEILAFDLAKLGVSKESFLKWNKKDLMDYKKLIKQNYKSTLTRAFNNRA